MTDIIKSSITSFDQVHVINKTSNPFQFQTSPCLMNTTRMSKVINLTDVTWLHFFNSITILSSFNRSSEKQLQKTSHITNKNCWIFEGYYVGKRTISIKFLARGTCAAAARAIYISRPTHVRKRTIDKEQDYKKYDAHRFTHGNKPISVLASVPPPSSEAR